MLVHQRVSGGLKVPTLDTHTAGSNSSMSSAQHPWDSQVMDEYRPPWKNMDDSSMFYGLNYTDRLRKI